MPSTRGGRCVGCSARCRLRCPVALYTSDELGFCGSLLVVVSLYRDKTTQEGGGGGGWRRVSVFQAYHWACVMLLVTFRDRHMIHENELSNVGRDVPIGFKLG